MTENWATLVNGDKAEKQKERHLPFVPLCWSDTQTSHCHTVCLTHTHMPSITHILYKQWHLWQKLEMALLRSWNNVHVTVPWLNCLCLTVPGLESKDIYLPNHFSISLPASTQSSTALPSGTNRPPERLDIIATSLRHIEADQIRNNKFNGLLVQWQCTVENVIQQRGKDTSSFKESIDEGKMGKVV